MERSPWTAALVSGAVPHHRLPLERDRLHPRRKTYDIDRLREGTRCETATPGRRGGDVRDTPTLEVNHAVDPDVIPAAVALAERHEDHSLGAKIHRGERWVGLATGIEPRPYHRPGL